ncbi:hypothetical protein [Blastococcus sp. SYSU DS0973]
MVVGYLRYQTQINGIVIALQLFAATTAFSALLTARLRSVVFGPWITAQIFLNVAMAVIAILAVRWTTNPPFWDGGDFAQLLADGDHMSPRELFENHGIEAVFFIGYQILGLLFSVLIVAFISLHSLKVFLATGLVVRRRVDPEYTLGRIRQWFLGGIYGGPSLPFGLAVFATMVSLFLISGLGFSLINRNVESIPSTPAPASTAPAPPVPTTPAPVPTS